MIAYLDGKLSYKSPTNVYIDIGGIAYDVNISLFTYGKIETLDKVKLYTVMIVREDSQTLYGFYDIGEKELFKKLISVSGIGPNTARVILSYMTPDETKSAILSNNVAAFKKVKGVGPKTAQRLMLDLKDKIAKEGLTLESHNLTGNASNTIREEALAALLSLGFQKSQVVSKIDKALASDSEIVQVEALIKAVLKILA